MWKCDRLWDSDYLESRNVISLFMTLSCDGWIFGMIWLVDPSFLKRKFFFFLYSLYLSILRTKVIMIGCFGDEALFISSLFVIYLFYELHFVTILAENTDTQHAKIINIVVSHTLNAAVLCDVYFKRKHWRQWKLWVPSSALINVHAVDFEFASTWSCDVSRSLYNQLLSFINATW